MTGVEDDFSLSPSRRKAEQQVHPLNRGENKIKYHYPVQKQPFLRSWTEDAVAAAQLRMHGAVNWGAVRVHKLIVIWFCLLQLWRVSVEADGVKERPVTLLLELLEELLYFVLHVFCVLDLQS